MEALNEDAAIDELELGVVFRFLLDLGALRSSSLDTKKYPCSSSPTICSLLPLRLTGMSGSSSSEAVRSTIIEAVPFALPEG